MAKKSLKKQHIKMEQKGKKEEEEQKQWMWTVNSEQMLHTFIFRPHI